jgi:hypothetical protein
MAKFRTRPLIKEAVRWTGNNLRTIRKFCPSANYDGSDHKILRIATMEGFIFASSGDWIIRGIRGEFYPCKPDIFAASYEPVGEKGK